MANKLLPRTDLALEAADTGDHKLPEGVFCEEKKEGAVLRTVVRIETQGAAERLGRPRGYYLTLEGPFEERETLAEQLASALAGLLPDGPALVVGLGNRSITPDLLGPETAKGILATRHLPPELLREIGMEGVRPVCALAPGVMGETGFEVAELTASLLRGGEFASVIAVDALAARSMTRLGRTIQLSDSGISPGSGVLNSRAALSRETLGVPVFAVGIPTVVDAAALCEEGEESREPLMATPRDIDRLIEQLAAILAEGINRALQPTLDPDELSALLS